MIYLKDEQELEQLKANVKRALVHIILMNRETSIGTVTEGPVVEQAERLVESFFERDDEKEKYMLRQRR